MCLRNREIGETACLGQSAISNNNSFELFQNHSFIVIIGFALNASEESRVSPYRHLVNGTTRAARNLMDSR